MHISSHLRTDVETHREKVLKQSKIDPTVVYIPR